MGTVVRFDLSAPMHTNEGKATLEAEDIVETLRKISYTWHRSLHWSLGWSVG
jgi:hypothetical protein